MSNLAPKDWPVKTFKDHRIASLERENECLREEVEILIHALELYSKPTNFGLKQCHDNALWTEQKLVEKPYPAAFGTTANNALNKVKQLRKKYAEAN